MNFQYRIIPSFLWGFICTLINLFRDISSYKWSAFTQKTTIREYKSLQRAHRTASQKGTALYRNGFAFEINTVRGSKWSIMTHFIPRGKLPRISCFNINCSNAFGHQSAPRYFALRFQRGLRLVTMTEFDLYSVAGTTPRLFMRRVPWKHLQISQFPLYYSFTRKFKMWKKTEF